ncbi:MAG: glycosyltransferase, partial [Actinomycetota bacterium]
PARSGVVGDGAGPYPPGTPWADPDLDAAARAMRTVVDDPVAAAAMGPRARDMLLAKHAPGHRAAFLHERLAALRKLVPGAAAAASAPGRPIGVRPSSPRLALR